MRLRDMKKQTQNKPNTNPIKPNLVRHSLGEGGFKRGTYAARLGYGDNEGEQK